MSDVEYLTVEHLSTKDLIRIFSKIKIDPAIGFNGTPCWVWSAGKDTKGYGAAWAKKHVKAHRFMFAWLVCPIPTGRRFGEIDHLCFNKPCCNPIHLDFVPAVENVRRYHAQRTSCKKGHELPPVTTATTSRQCPICPLQRRKQSRTRKQQIRANLLQRQRYALNPERGRLRGAVYREANREAINQRIKESRHRDREAHNTQARLWRQANRDKVNERQRKWRAEHPDEYKATNRTHNNKRYKNHSRQPIAADCITIS